MPIIKVLLADDWGLFLEGVKSALRQATADIEIVGEATNGEDAVQLTRRLDPAVVLMDQDLPKAGGIEATRAIKQAMPGVEIIIMTERLDDAEALAAIEAGCRRVHFEKHPGCQSRHGPEFGAPGAGILSPRNHPQAH